MLNRTSTRRDDDADRDFLQFGDADHSRERTNFSFNYFRILHLVAINEQIVSILIYLALLSFDMAFEVFDGTDG